MNLFWILVKIKQYYWKSRLKIGKNFVMLPNVILGFDHPRSLSFGDNVSINRNTIIDASDGGQITIYNNVMIGPNVVIRASNHKFDSIGIPMKKQGHKGGVILIQDDVWIGCNSVILPNVVITTGTIVGAGSVVTKEFPSYSIIAGNPAKVINTRGVINEPSIKLEEDE